MAQAPPIGGLHRTTTNDRSYVIENCIMQVWSPVLPAIPFASVTAEPRSAL
jgi:hypothetical protein